MLGRLKDKFMLQVNLDVINQFFYRIYDVTAQVFLS